MELNEIINALENCRNIVCDICPLFQEGVHCMEHISKLLRQEVDKILGANNMVVQELKEEIEELKQENIELDEKLHERPSYSTFEFKIPCSEDVIRWLKSMP